MTNDLGKLESFTNLNSSAIWGWFPLLTNDSQGLGRSEVVIKFTQINILVSSQSPYKTRFNNSKPI